MPEMKAHKATNGYTWSFTFTLLAALLLFDALGEAVLEAPVLVAVVEPVEPVVGPEALAVDPVVPAPLVGAAGAPETPRAARLTPLEMDEVVTQFEEEGVE